jgi:putative membrane protein
MTVSGSKEAGRRSEMKPLSLFAASLLALGASTAACLAQAAPDQNYQGPWHMMHDWTWGGGGMILGPLYMIIWLAILVAVVILVMRYMGAMPATRNGGMRTPREILDERYARGEIDHDEYEKRRKALGG